MRHYLVLTLAAFTFSLSLGFVKAASAEEVVVVRSEPPRHHYVQRDGYYWEGQHAYKRVWIAREHRYDYRAVDVRPRVVVVHDDHHDHDDRDRH
jgi:hypothetical protein